MSFNFSVTEQQRRKKKKNNVPYPELHKGWAKKELETLAGHPAINQVLLRHQRASPAFPPAAIRCQQGYFTFQRLVAVRNELVIGADVEDVHEHLGDCKRHRQRGQRAPGQGGEGFGG